MDGWVGRYKESSRNTVYTDSGASTIRPLATNAAFCYKGQRLTHELARKKQTNNYYQQKINNYVIYRKCTKCRSILEDQ